MEVMVAREPKEQTLICKLPLSSQQNELSLRTQQQEEPQQTHIAFLLVIRV